MDRCLILRSSYVQYLHVKYLCPYCFIQGRTSQHQILNGQAYNYYQLLHKAINSNIQLLHSDVMSIKMEIVSKNLGYFSTYKNKVNEMHPIYIA